MALLLVLAIVGALTTIGLAAIATATLTTRAGENFAAHASALQAAQSGVEVAASRLGRPWDVGLSWGELWSGTGGFEPLPQSQAGGEGRCDAYYQVTVTEDEESYFVTSTGLAVSPGGSPTDEDHVQARSTVKAVLTRPKLDIPYAALSSGLMLVPTNTRITGDVFSNGDLWVWFGGRITGSATCAGMMVNFGAISGTRRSGAARVSMPPVGLDHYWPRYDYGGLTASPVRLYGSAGGILPNDVPGNPDNIYYSDSGFDLSNATLNGTMLVRGDLRIDKTTVIDARPGMPAMIVQGDLILANTARLTTHGLVIIRGTVKGTGNNSASSAVWDHNGPLVFEQGGGFASNLQSAITVNYRLDRTAIQPVSRMQAAVRMVRYSETQ